MASTSDVRKGVVIKHQNDLYVVVEFQHINPGKGSALVRTRMKSLASGKVIEITYKTSETIEIVSVLFQNMQYLYKNGDRYVFMDISSYELVEMEGDLVSDDANVTKEIKLDNGLLVHAPIFIKEGEEILVNTETGEYSARA